MGDYYGIIRDAKLHWSDIKKVMEEMQRTLKMHTEEFREFNHSLIDWNKTDENIFFVKCDDWKKEIDSLCDEFDCKRKKDSVVAINTVYAITPEWLATHTEAEAMEYFKKCYQFHIKEFCSGNENLMLSFVIHKDETHWHAHATSVPILHHRTTNKRSGKTKEYYSLDAKKILGGRIEHSRRQDRFYNEVSKEFGLLRGTPKPISRRRHRDQMEMHLETLRNTEKDYKYHAAKAVDELYKVNEALKIYKENSLDRAEILKEVRALTYGINETGKALTEEYERLEKEYAVMQKNYIYREWKLLKENHPEWFKIIHQENIALKEQESSNRKIVRNQNESDNEIYR